MAGFLTPTGARLAAQNRGAGASGIAQEGRSLSGRGSVGVERREGGKRALGPGVHAVPGGARPGGSLDTLAQLDQNPGFRPEKGTVLEGDGGSRAKLLKRARSMYLSKPMATRLAEVAKVEGSPLQQSYRNTIYCNATLSQESGKIVGTYCGNRWCMTCSRIRTALAIQRYLPVLREWKDRQFVTLTVRNIPADQLGAKIDAMLAAFTAAKRAIKRTDRVAFKALRKLECTYNLRTDEYHPHFHVQVEGRRAAELLVKRWMEQFPDETDRQGQDIRPANDDESLLELFKYFTKLMTKQKLMPVKALDVIFRSMRGRRVYQPVGFVAPKDAADDEGEIPLDEGTEAPTRPNEVLRWVWSQGASDWIDASTGECLSGYEPNEKFRELVEAIGREAEQPELLSAVRGLAPEEKIDVEASRDEMRRRMNAMERNRAPDTSEVVSNALRKIWAVTAERARELAPVIAMLPDTQLELLGGSMLARPRPSLAFSD